MRADFGDDLQRVFSQKLEGLPPDQQLMINLEALKCLWSPPVALAE